MGRPGRRDWRLRVEEAPALRVADALRAGVRPDPLGHPPAGVTIRLEDGTAYLLAFTTTRQRLGGWRVWFLCPRCGGRKGMLYLVPGRPAPLACRTCHGLVYGSTTLSQEDRLYRRGNQLYAQLGTTRDAVMAGRFWRKPRYMRYATFRFLLDQADRYYSAALMQGSYMRSVILPNLTRPHRRW